MIRFIYGNKKDFNDMKRAKRLSDEDIQHMVDDVTNVLLDKIRRNDDDNWTYLATGDTMVIGFVFDEDYDKQYDTIEIFVCKNYEEAAGWYNGEIRYENFEKMDWSKDYEKEEMYQDYTREELIDMIEDYKRRESYYNPRREV